MRVVYLDAALHSELGHFAGVCRQVVRAFREVNQLCIVCGNFHVALPLREELSIHPLFRYHPNARVSDDPVCGWIENYQEIAKHTADDLGKIEGLQFDDLVVYNCARPSQILALANWVQSRFHPSTCPKIFIILGWPTGMEVERDPTGKIKSWRLFDQASCLYRHAVRQIRPEFLCRFRFGCPEPTRVSSEAYEALTGYPVTNVPASQSRTTPFRDRSKTEVPVISFLGEQREDKGFHLVPSIVRSLLQNKQTNFRILVQNSWSLMEQQNNELKEIANNDPRLTFRIGTLTKEMWDSQLFESDLIVLPYQLSTYSTNISGIGAEAIANGIPQVVPAQTGLEKLLMNYGSPGVVFDIVSVAAIVEAVQKAISLFGGLAEKAKFASFKWEKDNSGINLANNLLKL